MDYGPFSNASEIIIGLAILNFSTLKQYSVVQGQIKLTALLISLILGPPLAVFQFLEPLYKKDWKEKAIKDLICNGNKNHAPKENKWKDRWQ